MRRLHVTQMVAAAGLVIAPAGCRDLHIHLHLPPRTAAGVEQVSGRSGEQVNEAPAATPAPKPTPTPAGEWTDDRQTPEEILQEEIDRWQP